MPVEVIWDDNNQTIIRQIYSGIVKVDDYYDAIDQFVEMAQSVPHTVHSIMDRRAIVTSEGSYLNILRYGNTKMPDNIGLRVIINPNGLTSMMVNIGIRIAPRLIKEVRIVDTLEDARAVIAEEKHILA